MNKAKLLVLSNGFPHYRSHQYHCQFVGEITKLVSGIFHNITVISPQPWLPTFLRKFTLLAEYTKLTGFRDYTIDNITVHYPSYLTLPWQYFRDTNAKRMLTTYYPFMSKIEGADIVHVHFLYPTGCAAIGVLPANTPKILSLHGGDLYEWALANQELATRTMSKFDVLHVPSSKMATLVRKLDPSLLNKIVIIPPPVDVNEFTQPGNKPAPPTKILMVANLIREKGLIDGIKVFQRLMAKNKDLTLDIIGEGPMHLELQRLIQKEKLMDRVRLLGPVSHQELPARYQQANLLLFPSYAESWGIVQIEALACGTPVVAYANDGSKEILADHPECLAKVGDIAELTRKATAILSKSSDAKIWRKLAMPYREEIIAREWERVMSSSLRIR